MKVTNTSGWNTPWLRQLTTWACRELGFDWRDLKAAHFCQAHRAAYRGWAYCEQASIRVKINPMNVYPLAARHHRGLPGLVQADAVEVLVRVTAHEIAHLERWQRFARAKWQRGERDTTRERDTESLARMVLKVFRERRAELLAAWGEAGPGLVPPAVAHQLKCGRCGHLWRSARPLPTRRRRSCPRCFRSWKSAAARGEFLIYERVPAADTVPHPATGEVRENDHER